MIAPGRATARNIGMRRYDAVCRSGRKYLRRKKTRRQMVRIAVMANIPENIDMMGASVAAVAAIDLATPVKVCKDEADSKGVSVTATATADAELTAAKAAIRVVQGVSLRDEATAVAGRGGGFDAMLNREPYDAAAAEECGAVAVVGVWAASNESCAREDDGC
jgi:hypothetical protein